MKTRRWFCAIVSLVWPLASPLRVEAEPDSGGSERNTGGTSKDDIAGVGLDRLLDKELDVSTFGSNAYRLPRHGISTYVHGTASLGLVFQDRADRSQLAIYEMRGKPWSFARTGFDLFTGANINDVIYPEAEVEAHVNGDLDDPMSIRYAQIDVRVWGDYLFARVGQFVVPMGGINVYPDPDYLHKFPEPPLFYRHVVPADFADVGAEVFGRAPLTLSMTATYALYISNGIYQPADPTSTAPAEGAPIYEMVLNRVDPNANKAIGGRIGIEADTFGFGLSGYTGAYTVDASRNLSIVDVDATLRLGPLMVKGEAALAVQQITGRNLNKVGYYVLASYRLIPELEPMVRVDGMSLDGPSVDNRTQIGVGAIVYPYPEKASTLLLKTSYSPSVDGDGQFVGHRFLTIAAVAF